MLVSFNPAIVNNKNQFKSNNRNSSVSFGVDLSNIRTVQDFFNSGYPHETLMHHLPKTQGTIDLLAKVRPEAEKRQEIFLVKMIDLTSKRIKERLKQ